MQKNIRKVDVTGVIALLISRVIMRMKSPIELCKQNYMKCCIIKYSSREAVWQQNHRHRIIQMRINSFHHYW